MADQEGNVVPIEVPPAELAEPAEQQNVAAMLQGIQPPTGLDLTSKQKAENWKLYKQRWENYSIVAQLHKQTEEYKVALFLYCIGPEAVKTYNSFDLTPANKRKLTAIIEAFDEYAIGDTNETYERYVFNSRAQKDGESIDKYVAELRTLAQTCNFCHCLHDSLIRDRIVLGVKDGNTRKRLLQQTKLDFPKCIEICRSFEASNTQLKSMGERSKAEDLHKVQAKPKPNARRANQAQHAARKQHGPESNPTFKACGYCGRKHKPGRESCPAWGADCKKCGKRNHYAKQCQQNKRSTAHAVTDVYSSDSDYIDTVTIKPETISAVGQSQPKEIYAKMLVKGKPVRFHVDCGATVNVMPLKYVSEEEIQPTDRVLQMWNKTEVKPQGTCRLTIRNPKNNKKYSVEFMVVKESLTPLLGAKVIQHMGLVEVHQENFEQVAPVKTTSKPKTAEQIIEEYNDVFEGDVGTLQGEQRLEVDSTVTPTVCPYRRVPFSVKPKLKTELERLTDLNVLIPVDEPTDWVSNLVVATKPSGDLRICLDPQQLNKALKREQYPLPVIDDVLPDLSKAKVFTKVDARNGYWHVVLDDDSSRLCTFDTPYGRYRWKRLPFGISVASEIFQKRLHEALDRLDGLLTVHDDMVVYGEGETKEEAIADHNKNLKAFLQRCRDKGVKLNKKKLMLQCTEIPYMGHLVTDQGLKPDPEKIEAVTNMPKPDDIKAVRRFCGFVNYLAKFLPHLADAMEPLRQLTHKDVPWQWNHEHDLAFEKIKKLVTTAPLLKYYDPKEELTVQCDASDKGLGAALLQKGQPVAFASRALTDTETRYAQIEKEMLAVVFALQKFDQYAYGRNVTVESDHKPLEAIARKPLRSAPKRIQGMLLKMQKYDVDIVYRPGAQMYLADTLSRAFLPSTENTQGEFERVNALKFLPMTEERQEQIRQNTDADEVLQQLKDVIRQGWPEEKQYLPAVLTPYFSYRDELSVYNGLIFKGERLVIPKTMRQQMKEEVHSSHIGTNGCLRRARECMFWPGMSAEIKEFIAQCEICRTYESRQTKETLMSHELTDRPWEKLAADLFTIDGTEYLVLVDYFSNYWEVDRLRDTKASTCIRKMKSHFARYGIPDLVISDNGPQFYSEEFARFAKAWSFEHRTSSPGHQQANGMAEAAVKSAKSLIRKNKDTGRDPYLALLDKRNTQTEGMDTSPAQRLMGRRCKTLLPTTSGLLKPQTVYTGEAKKQTRRRQERQAHYYNQGAKDLPALEEGDQVRMRPFKLGQKAWEKATVTKRYDERSYEIETDRGTYRRNRVDIKKTSETPASPQTRTKGTDKESLQPSVTPPKTTNQPAAKPTAVETPKPTEGLGSSHPNPDSPKPQTSMRPKRMTKEPSYLKDYVRK